MRYLIDACVHQGLLDELRRLGINVVRLSTESNFSDTEVLAIAFGEGRIVITNDKGFGDLVLRKRQPCLGAILVRVEVGVDTPVGQIAQTIVELGGGAAGNFCTIDKPGLRKRAL